MCATQRTKDWRLRVSALGAEGRRFKSDRPDHICQGFSTIASSGYRVSCLPRVLVGSWTGTGTGTGRCTTGSATSDRLSPEVTSVARGNASPCYPGSPVTTGASGLTPPGPIRSERGCLRRRPAARSGDAGWR